MDWAPGAVFPVKVGPPPFLDSTHVVPGSVLFVIRNSPSPAEGRQSDVSPHFPAGEGNVVVGATVVVAAVVLAAVVVAAVVVVGAVVATVVVGATVVAVVSAAEVAALRSLRAASRASVQADSTSSSAAPVRADATTNLGLRAANTEREVTGGHPVYDESGHLMLRRGLLRSLLVAHTPDDLPEPTESPLVPRWFKVWLLVATVAGALFAVANLNSNETVVPPAVFLGALAGPLAFSTWVTDKTRVGRSVPPDILYVTWIIGGGLGAMFTAIFSTRFFFDPTGTGVLWVGIVEEAAKVATPLGIYIFARKYRSVEQALAFAMVSAAGFAVFESLSYGLAALDLSVSSARNTLLWRSALTPFGHLPWTGLAVVVAVKAWEPDDRPSLSPLAWWGFIAAVGLHTAWNLTLVEGGWLLLITPLVGAIGFWMFFREIRDVFYDGPYAVPAEHAVWPRWLKSSSGPWTPRRRGNER